MIVHRSPNTCSRRSQTQTAALWIAAVAFVGVAASAAAVVQAAPADFAPVDTSRVLGSPDPLPLKLELAFPNLQFERPVELAYAPDGSNRLFLVEQDGVIRVFQNEAGASQSKVFLDIHEVVSRDHNEEGLLGLAFHPKFRENGEFFVYYSTRPRASVVSRFRVSADDPDRADRASEEEIMHFPQPFGNHNGGSMKFGPDGYLYIGLGDGGSGGDPFGNAQNLTTLLGSVLRIDIDHRDPGLAYAIPKDNPFADRGGGVRGEIWAYGVRNIWRLAFDRKTGDLWAGDVGQDQWEEVDIIRRGGNYGWNLREGLHPFKPNARQTGGPLIDPLIDYSHEEGRSITGGVVYRGTLLPQYEGAYFYADFVTGNIWMLRYDGEKVTEHAKVGQTELQISAFGEDAVGEMYLTAFDGRIYRLRPRGEDLEAMRAAFPRRLAETGLFVPGQANQPVPGVMPYDVQVPLWSDFAVKHRYIALPRSGMIGFKPSANWDFPVGSVLVKTFAMNLDREHESDPKLLETRLLVHSPEGWVGYTYLWNDEATDAFLIDDAVTKTYRIHTAAGDVDQSWYFPSRADCMTCHTQARGFVLGPNTRQLNREAPDVAMNQLTRFDRAGMFSRKLRAAPNRLERYPQWGSADAPVGELARAYLDVNCAMCHAKMAVRGARPDFDYHTPLGEASIINRQPAQGVIGPPGSKLIVPDDPAHSEIITRMSTRGVNQMPPLATSHVDEAALKVLSRWVDELGDKRPAAQ